MPFLGVGVDPGPEAAATLASELVVAGQYLSGDGGDGRRARHGAGRGARRSKPGDRVTLMATTHDGSLNAVDAVVAGLVDVRIKEFNDRYLAAGIGPGLAVVPDLRDGLEAGGLSEAGGATRTKRPRALEKAFAAAGFPVAVRHWKELAVFYGQVRLLYIGIFGFVGAVLVVIVILSAAIVMTMAVTERTREIGTLRALGTRPSGILRMFLAEGVVIARRGVPGRTALRAASSARS